MTTSFLPIGKCVILSVLHQQSNILKEWHLINIHKEMVVEKGGSILPVFHFVSCFIYFHIFYNTSLLKKTTDTISLNPSSLGYQIKLSLAFFCFPKENKKEFPLKYIKNQVKNTAAPISVPICVQLKVRKSQVPAQAS